MHVSAFWMWQSGWPIQTVLRNLSLRPTLNIYCCSELLWSTRWFSSQLRGEVLQYLEVTHLQRSQVSFFFPPVRFTTADASLWHSRLNANPELSTAPKKMKSILTFLLKLMLCCRQSWTNTRVGVSFWLGITTVCDVSHVEIGGSKIWRVELFLIWLCSLMHTLLLKNNFFPSHFLSMHKRFNYKERRTHSSQSA